MAERADGWRRISSKTIADCKIFKVKENQFVRENTDSPVPFYLVEVPDWVNIIALTGEDDVVLIEQYRQGIEEMVLEIPSGVVDDGEEPEAAARRELAEETGFEAAEWFLLGTSQPNAALHNNRVHHYLARGARKTREAKLDENESVATTIKCFGETKRLVDDGTIGQSMIVAAFYYFDLFNRKNESTAS